MLDLLYLAWNRKEFTKLTFMFMLMNTDWGLVSRLYVYDDISEDGTSDFLAKVIPEVPVPVTFVQEKHGSPVAVMNDYLRRADSELFAKIDSDVCLPQGWLTAMTGVLEAHPDVELLGMEAGRTWLIGRDGREWDGVYEPEQASHIGGVGLMRTSAFTSRPPLIDYGARLGFDHWQKEHDVPRAWIAPDLMVPLLDRLPYEPWLSISSGYRDQGWQRPHGVYDERWMLPYYEWVKVGPCAIA